MRSLSKSAAATILLGSVASVQAGQTFSFTNPFAGGGSSYSNSMFTSTGVYSGIPASTIESFYLGTVNLSTTTFSNTGVLLAQETTTGVSYTLTNAVGDFVLSGTKGSNNAYVVQGGTLTFTKNNEVLLSIDFSGANQTNQTFGSDASLGQTVTFSGTKLTTTQTQNAKFSFGFPAPIFSNPANPGDPVHYTSDYTSSIGATEAVPEPASMVALGAGALALLRRKRKA
jgi:hypothetical protein